jgi:hypothetical protein
MERRAVVKTYGLAQLGQADPVAMSRNLLENCERAPNRLNAAALAIFSYDPR